MKPTRKLTLRKETLAALTDAELRDIVVAIGPEDATTYPVGQCFIDYVMSRPYGCLTSTCTAP